MPLLRWVLVAQIAFFGAWGGYLLTSHRVADTVWLETEPVDPRDLLSGHYVALRYRLTATATSLCAAALPADHRGSAYVRLNPTPGAVMTLQGPVQVFSAVECRAAPPHDVGGVWIRGERSPGPGLRNISFGIDRFYVPEASALRIAQSGDVVAKIAINEAGQARIVDLVRQMPITEEPPESRLP